MWLGLRGAGALALALGVTLVALPARTARAQGSSNLQAAQALHDKAVELMGQGRYGEACPKLEEVTRLVPDGLGAKLTLAECYEGEGKLASAWAEYTTVEQLAGRAGQAERQQKGAEGAARLKPRLAYLTIRVPEEVKSLPELEVKRGSPPSPASSVGPAQFGEPIPIDKGQQTIEVAAAHKKTWRKAVDVPADGAQLSIDVPPLDNDPHWRRRSGTGSAAANDDWMIPVGFAIGGVGAAGLIVGGVLGGLAMSSNGDAEDQCPGGFCSADGNDSRKKAGTFADASTGLFIAGGVLAGTGIIILALAPWGSSSSESKGASVRLRVGLGGLELSGRFQ